MYYLDNKYFIEGLEFIDNNHILISTGMEGSSKIGILALQEPDFKNDHIDGTRKPRGMLSLTKGNDLNKNSFCEGATVFKNKIY